MVELRRVFELASEVVSTELTLEGESPALESMRRGRRDLTRYRMLGEIGRGGMGVVHRVWDPELRRTLALKLLRRRTDSNDPASDTHFPHERLRHLEEAQILGQLQHPAIVPVLDIGFDAEADIFFTMPLVQGENLEGVIARVQDPKDSWSLARAVATVLRVCEAVAYAHSKGVLHRDLKPRNVMVGPYGETYVMDWGLAKVRGQTGHAPGNNPPNEQPHQSFGSSPSNTSVNSDRRDLAHLDPGSMLATHAGTVVGTAEYMAPEQALGQSEQVDERSDIFSLGAILYQVLGGRPPYHDSFSQRPKPSEVIERVRAGPPTSLLRLAPTVPEELQAICQKAMSRDARDRYVTASRMADDLRAHLEDRVVRAHRTGAWIELWKWTLRHRAVVAVLLALAGTMVFAAIAMGLLWQRSERHRESAELAQADSLRRQGALRVMSPTSPNSPSFTDSFDDGRLDRRWVSAGLDSHHIEERDDHLILTAGGGMQTWASVELDPYISLLRGEFDVSIRYRLGGFDVPEIERAERIARMALLDAVHQEELLSIGRHAEKRPGVCDGVEQTMRAFCRSAEESTCVEDSGFEGRMRLTRRGDTVSAFTWDGAWHELASVEDVTAPLRLQLMCINWYSPQSASFEIDELSIDSEYTISPEVLSEYHDSFSDAAIDARLTVRANAGFVSEIDDQLHMKKLKGRAGFVQVALHPTLWKLAGNGEVSVGYELRSFPLGDEGQTVFALRLKTTRGIHFGTIQVTSHPDGLRFLAWYHDKNALAPLRDKIGRLRIRRSGTSIFFEYWEDAWVTLLERPLIPEALDMSFAIDLEAQELDEECEVSLNDLSVSSITTRF